MPRKTGDVGRNHDRVVPVIIQAGNLRGNIVRLNVAADVTGKQTASIDACYRLFPIADRERNE